MYNNDEYMNSPFPMPLSPQMDPYASAMYPGIMANPTPATNYQFAPEMQPSQPSYARGGSVNKRGLKEIAQMLREQGEGEDKILAYLSPQEAQRLGKRYGSDINPHTGLPQYGWFKKGKKLLKKVSKEISHVPLLKTVLPIAGAVGGNFLLPGLGGVIGGGAAGALSNKKPLKGLIGGAAMGALQGYGMPLLGKGLTNAGMPMLGQGFQQLGRSQLGSGLSSVMGGLGLGGTGAALAKDVGPAAAGAAVKEGAASKGLGLSDLLLPLAVMGMLKGKTKFKTPKEGPKDPFIEAMKQKKLEALNEVVKPIKAYEPPAYMFELPEMLEESHGPAAYKQGGFIDGESGGQDDNVESELPEGGYVINATVVSALGDGNTKAGANKLDKLFGNMSRFSKGGKTKGRTVRALVSNGEYFVPPEEVTAFGKGNNAMGAKKLDKMSADIMKQKGMKKFPPKAKSISRYV